MALGVFATVALIVADNVGTGMLALPGQIAKLGRATGLCLLVTMLIPNLYAALLLHRAATIVEQGSGLDNGGGGDGGGSDEERSAQALLLGPNAATSPDDSTGAKEPDRRHRVRDYAGLASALFGGGGLVSRATSFFYFFSVFAQMSNYLVVLAQTLQAALVGALPLCRPYAGLLAALITFVLNQLPSMDALGRGPAAASVAAVAVVGLLCLTPPAAAGSYKPAPTVPPTDALGRMLWVSSGIGGVTFAVSPTLVMLNTRHAMAVPAQLPRALLLGVGAYSAAFIALVLLAGDAPPAFLFDLIPQGGARRRVTAVLLFAHVAVSYAISSVALCSAADRYLARRLLPRSLLGRRPRLRWAVLTTAACLAAWLVANAAPFFDGLVELIGSVCVNSFFFPALFLRKAHASSKRPLSAVERAATGALMGGAVLLTTSGLTGAVVGIVHDWSGYGPPFACHLNGTSGD